MAREDILVVDDTPTNLRLVEYILQHAGYPVRTATNASEALAAIAAARPRIILVDVQMPGTSGLELTHQLKTDPATRDIIIIAVTAYAMKGDDAKASDAGCDEYVTKPIDKRALRHMIARYFPR